MPLSITVSELPDRCVRMNLHGEVDCATAPELREAINDVLVKRNPATVEIDVAEITLLDSTGIGTLVVGHRIARDLCIRLVVVNPSRFVARLFSVIGVADLLGVNLDEELGDQAGWPVTPAQRAMTAPARP
ncbi:MAG: STAS domain-containing protein [Micromonosporaceae bacterium]